MSVDPPSVVDCASAVQLHCEALEDVLRQLCEPDAAKEAKERREIVALGIVALLKLKAAHRGAYEAAETSRVTTSSAKTALESGALQLANLVYQRSHHEADIAACLDDRSAYTAADLELLSEQEFIKQTGDQWHGEMDDDRRHAFNIARFENERSTRQALQIGSSKAKLRKAGITAVVAQKRRYLDSLTSEVSDLRRAGEPLRGMLSCAPQGAILPARSENLPLPLYILSSHVAAAAQTTDGAPIEVSVIDWSPPPADTASTQTAADVDMTDMTDGAAADVRHEEEEEGALPDTLPADVDADSAADVAKGSASSDSEEGSEAGEPARELSANDGRDAVDALAVRLTVGVSGASIQLSFVFTYCPGRHVILTAGENTETRQALAHMAAAEEPPKSRQSAKASSALSHQSSLPASDQVYRWAQQLAGTDFLAAPSPMTSSYTVAAADGNVLAGLEEYRSSGRVPQVLEQLRAAGQAIVQLKP